MTTHHSHIIGNYIQEHPATVLGTIGPDQTPQGAMVYTCIISTAFPLKVYFLTKNDTQKYHNIRRHPQVSLTYFSARESSTLQANGTAVVEHDPHTINAVMELILDAQSKSPELLPPVVKLNAGEYEVVGIELTRARLAEYGQGVPIGHPRFTELED